MNLIDKIKIVRDAMKSASELAMFEQDNNGIIPVDGHSLHISEDGKFELELKSFNEEDILVRESALINQDTISDIRFDSDSGRVLFISKPNLDNEITPHIYYLTLLAPANDLIANAAKAAEPEVSPGFDVKNEVSHIIRSLNYQAFTHTGPEFDINILHGFTSFDFQSSLIQEMTEKLENKTLKSPIFIAMGSDFDMRVDYDEETAKFDITVFELDYSKDGATSIFHSSVQAGTFSPDSSIEDEADNSHGMR